MRPSSINPSLAVTGSCTTEAGTLNGFVRDVFGRVTIFNIDGKPTEAVDINASGAVTGLYDDAKGVHGFLRSPVGTITSFDVPFQSCGVLVRCTTFPSAINDGGTITGSWQFGGGHPQGFVRSADGTFALFINTLKGLVPFDVNREGAITGSIFQPITDIPQGFMRSPDGTSAGFQIGFSATIPFGINRDGVTAGIWRNPFGNPHGFLRSPDGSVTSFDYPGDVVVNGPIFVNRSSSGVLGGINAFGVVTGTYVDKEQHTQGYVRSSNGILTTFNLGPGDTTAVSINDLGIVTGSYSPDSKTSRGFLRVPFRSPT
jgi:hypothetical protein